MQEHTDKKVLFIVTMFSYMAFSIILMVFIDCYWYAYLILTIIIIAIGILRFTVLWRGFIKCIAIAILIVLSCISLNLFRADRDVSFRGVVVRETIRVIMQMPRPKEDGFIDSGINTALKESLWTAPRGYTIEEYDLDGLYMELLTNDNIETEKVIMHLHGGAFTVDYTDFYRMMSLRYSKASGGYAVASVDYRIAPEYTYPAALEDAEKAWEWLIAEGYDSKDIIIVGDSAGGNLALALTAKLRDEERDLPKAMVLMSPWTDMTYQGDSYKDNEHLDPIFGSRETSLLKDYRNNIYAYGANLNDVYLSPAYGEFNGFPPMLIQVGTYEMLESDSDIVYERANEEGIEVVLTKYKGMFHVFQMAGNLIPESKLAWEEISEYLHQIN